MTHLKYRYYASGGEHERWLNLESVDSISFHRSSGDEWAVIDWSGGKQERIEASSAASALKAAWNAYQIQQETESVKS